MTQIQSLTRYKRWANVLLYDTAENLTEQQLAEPRPIVFGNIIRTLNHTYCMDLAWKANLLGEDHGFTTRNPESYPTLDELREKQLQIDRWYVEYVSSLPPAKGDEVVEFQFIGGGQGTMTREDILFHVVNHGTYHRGNVTGMMYECGVHPPATDYPVFLRTELHQT